MDLCVILLFGSFNLLFAASGYWAGRNSAGLPASAEPKVFNPGKVKAPPIDPYEEAMQDDKEERIPTTGD